MAIATGISVYLIMLCLKLFLTNLQGDAMQLLSSVGCKKYFNQLGSSPGNKSFLLTS